MIKIVCWDGSVAYADTPERAVYAACWLWDEAVLLSIPAGVTCGYPQVSFYVDGQCVRTTGNRAALGRLLEVTS